MKQILPIFALVLLNSSAFAKTTDYKLCQVSTDKIFQLAKIDGHKLPHIFNIKENGLLEVNEKYVELTSYNNLDQSQEYKFKTITKNKSLLRLFGRNETSAEELNYTFKVQRDSKNRIKSITQIPNCENCKGSKGLEFTYSKNNCVPKSYITENLEGKKSIAMDTLVCKQVMDNERALLRAMNKGKKCLNNLQEHYQSSANSISRNIARLETEAEGIENYSESLLTTQLKLIESTTNKLLKPLSDYSAIEDDSIELRSAYSSIMANCLDKLDKKMLKANEVFNKNGHFKREDKPQISQPEESQGVDN